MGTCDAAVVFHTEKQVAALRVGQRHHGSNQLAVKQAFEITLELSRQVFTLVDKFKYLSFRLTHGELLNLNTLSFADFIE